MFAYFGAKHHLSRYYPPPQHHVIIEPFAGAAGYSCFWGRGRDVVLIDSNPNVIALWHRLIDDPAYLREADRQVRDCERTNHPVVKMMSHISPLVWDGDHTWKITTTMRRNWPTLRQRIRRYRTFAKDWTFICGDYTDAPDVEATWFVDPPYQPRTSHAGLTYEHNDIDYPALGQWCRERRGQVIACDQGFADWLDFRPFRAQNAHSTTTPRTNVEMIWTNT